MLKIAITGGAGSGKSTVARMFRELGAEVLDADAAARQAVAVGKPAWRELRRFLGPECFKQDGELNRARVARLVFSDPDYRRCLNEHCPPEGGPGAYEAPPGVGAPGGRGGAGGGAPVIRGRPRERPTTGSSWWKWPRKTRCGVFRNGTVAAPWRSAASLRPRTPSLRRPPGPTTSWTIVAAVNGTRSQVAAIWRELQHLGSRTGTGGPFITRLRPWRP